MNQLLAKHQACLTRIVDIGFLILLALAAIYSSYFLERIEFSLGILGKTIHLDYDAFFGMITTGLFALLLITHHKDIKWSVWNFVPLAWPLLHILNARQYDYSSFILTKSALFFGFLLFVTPIAGALFQKLTLFKKHALLTFTLSFTLSIIAPLLFLNSDELYFQKPTDLVPRFAGYSTDFQVFPVIASILIAFSLVHIYTHQTKKSLIEGGIAALVGIVGLYLGVSRMAILIVAGVFLFLFVWACFDRKRPLPKTYRPLFFVLLLILGISTVSLFFSNSLHKRNGYDHYSSYISGIYEKRVVLNEPFDLVYLDEWINTNGRLRLYQKLLDATQFSSSFVGQGTAASWRFLKESGYHYTTPHSEYLRTFFDHGWLGIIVLTGSIISFMALLHPKILIAPFFVCLGWMASSDFFIESIGGFTAVFLLTATYFIPPHTRLVNKQ